MKLDENSPYEEVKVEKAGAYLRGIVRGHSLADSRGRVYVHRAVLFDAVGDGPHRCGWCGMDGLRWRLDPKDPDNLTVDHRNGDGDDNRLSNLVAAHKWCNDNRASIERERIPWDTFADVPIPLRPALQLANNGGSTERARQLGRDPARHPLDASGSGGWADLLDLEALEQRGEVELRRPTADLVRQFPQLHRLRR